MSEVFMAILYNDSAKQKSRRVAGGFMQELFAQNPYNPGIRINLHQVAIP